MSKNEFDDLLRKKWDEAHFDYSKRKWEQFSEQLPTALKKERKHLPVTIALGIAAALALLIASVLLVKLLSGTAIIPDVLQGQSISKALPQTAVPENGEKTDERHLAGKIAANKRKIEAKTLSSTTTKQHLAQQPAVSSFKDNNAITTYSSNSHNQETNLQVAPVLNEAPVRAKATDWEPKKTINIATFPIRNQGTVTRLLTQSRDSLRIQGFGNTASSNLRNETEKDRQQTLLAFGGGMNYGSMNSGYSVGISAQHKLSKSFFVEGTVAVMYNNNINNSGKYSGAAPYAARPGSYQAMSAPLFTPSQNLSYMQFNPSFGYEIGEKLSISLGGDVQQMISDNKQVAVRVNNEGLLLFPIMDFGITGKTEFNVAPHIQAGMIFREGLNNFLENNTTQYVNRRYFEIQFKYSIPVR